MELARHFDRLVTRMQAHDSRWVGELGKLLYLEQMSGFSPRYAYQAFRQPVWIIDGAEKESGEPISYCHAGGEPDKRAFVKMLFGSIDQETCLGPIPTWRLGSHQEVQRCALINFRVAREWLPLVRRLAPFVSARAIHLPASLTGYVDISDEARLLQSDSAKDDRRRIKKMNYGYRLATGQEEYVEFLERYYRPTIVKRHGFEDLVGDYAFLQSKSYFEREKANWQLVCVERDGKWESGFLVCLINGMPYNLEVGVLDGDEEYHKQGALSAAYWYGFEHFRSLGYQRLCLCFCPPLLNDGLTRYKKKWGMEVADQGSGGQLLTINELSPGLRSFLRRTPFCARRGKDLIGVAFVEELPPDPEAKAIRKRFFLPGLSDFLVLPVEDHQRIRLET